MQEVRREFVSRARRKELALCWETHLHGGEGGRETLNKNRGKHGSGSSPLPFWHLTLLRGMKRDSSLACVLVPQLLFLLSTIVAIREESKSILIKCGSPNL